MTRLCLILAMLAFGAVAHAAPKPLIYYGWDNPRISSLQSVLPKLAKSPFDSMAVTTTKHTDLLTTKPISPSDFSDDLNILEQLKSGQLSQSYLLILSAADEDFDWTNDEHWNSVRQNLKLYGQLIKAGSFKGLVFDMEPYGKNPWSFSSQQNSKKLNFASYAAVVRKRGEEMLHILQTEVPALEVWSLSGLTANVDSDLANLAADGYGLWPSFFNGWSDAAEPWLKIIDGNETSYGYTKRQEFLDAQNHITQDLKALLAPESRVKYERTIQTGQAVYVDGVMGSAKSPRFIGYYLNSDKARLSLLKSNIQNALRSSQSLVWVYTEIPKWWEAEPNAAIDRAIREAKSDDSIPVDQLETATAAKALSERISIGGHVRDKSGKGIKVTRFEPALANVACSTWGDDGAYGCEFPKGTKITIEPILEGNILTPKRVVRTHQMKSDWEVDFTAQ